MTIGSEAPEVICAGCQKPIAVGEDIHTVEEDAGLYEGGYVHEPCCPGCHPDTVPNEAYTSWTEDEVKHAAKQMVLGRGWICGSGDPDFMLMGGLLFLAMKPWQVPAEAVGMFSDFDVTPPLPRSVTGKPMLTGGRWINREDGEKIIYKARAIEEAMNQ